MKTKCGWALLAGVLCISAGSAFAADWFVATNGNDSAAGTSWATAKLTIQAAIDAATSNDTVWVSNGVYATGGGRAVAGTHANRVAIDRPITVRSMNGPSTTFIVGGGMRCAYVTNGAVLSGFTVTNGICLEDPYGTQTDYFGGGALCEHSGVLTNCIIAGNLGDRGGGTFEGVIYNSIMSGNQANEGGGACGGTLVNCILNNNFANGWGGGASDCILNNCLMSGNSASEGGGASGGELNNCTVVSNSAGNGGGVLFATVNNCIVYGNTAMADGANYYLCTFANSCTTPAPGGTGNITNAPLFVDVAIGNYRVQTNSPCINAGDNALVQGATDLDGNPRIANSFVDMGAYESTDTLPVLAIEPASTNLSFEMANDMAIAVVANVTWMATTNVPWLMITSGDAGTTNGAILFNVAANAGGSRTGMIMVAGGGFSRTSTVIQAKHLATWHVATNGNDSAAGTSWATAKLTIQAAIDAAADDDMVWVGAGIYQQDLTIAKGIRLASTNGPQSTTIRGNGGRCISVTHTNAVVSGFTITGGRGGDGAGVNMPYQQALLEKCIVIDNGTVGGAGTVWGGGVYGGRIRSCLIVSNFIYLSTGEQYADAAALGAGAAGCILENCTLVGNTASVTGYYETAEGGYYDGFATNSIIWSNWGGTSYSGSHWSTNMGDPLFADGEYHLQAGSPCIDAGTNQDWMVGAMDLDCHPRIAYGTVDLGAYELVGRVWHVATNGNDSADGTSWATAKLTIQAAIDAAVFNDTVWVSNGVYATGGRVVHEGLLSRVAIDKPITVQSVNGPEVTIIQGAGPVGDSAVRCAYVGTNAALSGFTLEQGATRAWSFSLNYDNHGGGAYCEDRGVLNHCILTGNTATKDGGGVKNGTLNHCNIVSNQGGWAGGGAYDCTLNDCLLIGNSAQGEGGGSEYGTLNNCTVVNNYAMDRGPGVFQSTLNNCIVYNNTAGSGEANHFGSTFNYSCTTPDPGGTGNITNDPQFVNAAAGNYRLNLDSPCINAGENALVQGATDLDGKPRNIYSQVDMGAYEYFALHVETNGNDAADGFAWATAKQTIQEAIDAAVPGVVVWVSNGVYATGGRAVAGVVSNRVVIDRPVTVQSVNGPEVTVIRGPGILDGMLMRCAYVGSDAAVSGFTLTDGTAVASGGDRDECRGGGVFIAGNGAVENCLITSNNVNLYGGGVYMEGDGRLDRCRITQNSASASGVAGGVFSSSGGRLDNCLIAGNYAEGSPGVCVQGGGMELVNCTISGNSSFGGPAVSAPTSTLWNCIVFSNHVDEGDSEIYGALAVASHCCSPGLAGNGNITNDPQFVDAAAGDYRLQAASPCIDAGDDSVVSWSEDLDGNPRVAYGTVDMGAYEAQLAGAGTWFGAITNGLANDTDCAACDGVPNLLKYATGSSPRISDDMAQMDLPSGGAPALVFHRNPHATDITLVVEGADAISNGAAWRGLATNIGGSWGGAANVSESGSGNPVVCTVEDIVPLQTYRFLRLKVMRP